MSAEPPQIDERAIREESARVLSSRTFHSADRLSRFLDYVIEQSVRGDAANIKEYSIGIEAFQRGPDFDPRSDSVVRVEARRLRSKLRDYYDTEGIDDPIIITIPTGSYVPVFTHAPARVHDNRGPDPTRIVSLAAAVVGVLVLMMIGWYAWSGSRSSPAIVILPLENLSADASNDFFCHALSDDVASRLNADSRFRVLTRGPAGPFVAGADTKTLARDHLASRLMEGSAFFSSGHIRVTVMLVDLENYGNLWSQSFDLDAREPLNAENELANTIAGEIRKRIL